MTKIIELLKNILRTLFDFFSDDDVRREKTVYRYKHKEFLMTYSEAQFYNQLIKVLEDDYYIFPQVHLPSIIDHRIKGQNWRAALAHINRKSVDYVLCETKNLRPICAIELDDKTHDSESRVNRDREVERILAEARLPLVRFRTPKKISDEEIVRSINAVLL